MFSWLKQTNEHSIKPIVIVVMDGFGIAPPNPGNAIHLAKKPVYDRMLKTYPWGQIIASGEAVGLPANEVGNSEVGHLTLGVGRVIFQSLERINRSVKDHSIYKNQMLLDAFFQAKKRGTVVHIMGLVGSGNVHSSLNHLHALLEMAKRQGVRVAIHAFTDVVKRNGCGRGCYG
jgi:2,3-bisphosphoglycerate-independent phosphoglycerate mutase